MESVIQLDPYRASLDFDVMRKAEVAEAIAADAEIHGAGLTWMAPFVTLGIAASPAVRAGHNLRAEVAELADAHGSGPCTRKGVGVRVPSSAPKCVHVAKNRGFVAELAADQAGSYRITAPELRICG